MSLEHSQEQLQADVQLQKVTRCCFTISLDPCLYSSYCTLIDAWAQERTIEAEAALEREKKLVISMQNMLSAISAQVAVSGSNTQHTPRPQLSHPLVQPTPSTHQPIPVQPLHDSASDQAAIVKPEKVEPQEPVQQMQPQTPASATTAADTPTKPTLSANSVCTKKLIQDSVSKRLRSLGRIRSSSIV